MRRTLPLAMLVSLATASPTAQALGLADPQIQSSLNEPLQARIDVIDLRGLDPSLLKARLADEAAFEQAGLPRSALAESVRMVLQPGAGGMQLVLTTERAVREPYLDLLVTLLWPGGQQRRQITLLFDPPGYASAPALIEGMEREVSQAQVGVALPADEASRPAASSSPTFEATPASQVRVRSGDTLWGLATRVRPSADISIDQVMLALLQANPEAFPNGNINGLRAGVELVVPSRQVMLASTPAEAVSLVQAQNRAWRGDAVESENVASSEARPPEPQVAERPPSDAQPRLTLLSDADLAAERAGTTNDIPDTPATESISEQRLIELTAQWQANREALALSREARERLESEIAVLRQDVAELREMLLAAEPEPIETAEAAFVATSGADAEPEPVTARAAAAPAGPSLSTLPPSNSSNSDRSGGFWRLLSDNLLVIAGVAIALLLALWALVRRRNADDHGRRAASFPLGVGSVVGGAVATSSSSPSSAPAATTTPLQSSVMQEAAPDTPQASESQADVPRASAPQADVPRASVPRASAPQTETISEADIFIAYGRFDQARELLKRSLEDDPERHDLRLKLLTVHVELGEREDAEYEAARLEALGGLDDPQHYRHEAQRLMSRFDGTAAQPDAPDGEFDVLHDRRPEDSGAADDTDDRAFDASSQQPQAMTDEVSLGVWDDETPSEDHDQAGEAETISEGYIEYEPPRLDSSLADRSVDNPVKHDDALRQPGIDYPGSLSDGDNDDDELDATIDISDEMPRRAADIEHDWEIEEVAFEPLNLDNETPNPDPHRAS